MKRVSSFCGVLCFGAAMSASASEVASDAPDSTITLRTVEVTANRATRETPVAFTDINAAELQRQNDGRDIPFILQMAPSVIATGDAGGGFGYSALRIRGTDASRINITANGIPINDSESHNVYWVNMPDLVSSLRSIQIQRGAGTSTNGAGAFGASVNMITDAPSSDAGALLSLGYGSYNANRQTLKVCSGLLADHWSIDARISHMGSDGYVDRAFSKLWSYMGQVAYTGGKTSLRLLAFGGKERTYMAWEYPTAAQLKEYGRRYNPQGEYTAADGSIAYYSDQCDNFVQHHFQLLLGQTLSDKWRLHAALHYTKGDGYYDQYKTRAKLHEYGLAPFTDADGNTVNRMDLIRLKSNDNDFGGGMVNTSYTGKNINVVIGTAANWHRGRHFGQIKWVRNYVGPINPLQEYYNNMGRKFDFNIYSRADWQFAKNWNAYVDLQYRHIRYSINGVSDNYDDNIAGPAQLDILRNYNFFNPKAGISYTAGNHRAYASWTVAHKEPVRDNFTDGDPHHYPRAERLFDYEIGYTFQNKLTTLSAGLFYMDYKDQLVVTGELSDTGNRLSVNVPSSYRAGIELQAALRPVKWFEWQINATLSRNRIRNFTEYIYGDDAPLTINWGSTPIAFSPDAMLNNTFNFSVAGFEAAVVTRYVNHQYMDNSHSRDARLPSYTVTDLSLAYTFDKIPSIRQLTIGCAVYNIFNRMYCNYGYAGAYYINGEDGKPVIERYAGYAPQAGTNVLATVTVKF